MLFLMDSFTTSHDAHGNPRKLIRVVCIASKQQYQSMSEYEAGKKSCNSDITNILWFDASYSGIPSGVDQLEEYYDVERDDGDRLFHLQDHEVKATTWNDLSAKAEA